MSNNKKCFCGRVVEPLSNVCFAHKHRPLRIEHASERLQRRLIEKPQPKPAPQPKSKTARVLFNTEEVLSATYKIHGNDFLIVTFAKDPKALPRTVQAAGDLLDAQLEQEASLLGIERLLIIIPGTGQTVLVRTYDNQSRLKKWSN